MILENDGKNAIMLIDHAYLGAYVEMLCGLFFGRRLAQRVGWPRETQERALLAWILCALDPMRAYRSVPKPYFSLTPQV